MEDFHSFRWITHKCFHDKLVDGLSDTTMFENNRNMTILAKSPRTQNAAPSSDGSNKTLNRGFCHESFYPNSVFCLLCLLGISLHIREYLSKLPYHHFLRTHPRFTPQTPTRLYQLIMKENHRRHRLQNRPLHGIYRPTALRHGASGDCSNRRQFHGCHWY